MIVDTSVLSEAFRRRARPAVESAHVALLRRSILEHRDVRIPGVVLQEILSGVRMPEDGRRLRKLLEGFDVVLATRDDHVVAADIANACRARGVACSTMDALIAAQTVGANDWLLTTDRDFERIAPTCGLRLHQG